VASKSSGTAPTPSTLRTSGIPEGSPWTAELPEGRARHTSGIPEGGAWIAEIPEGRDEIPEIREGGAVILEAGAEIPEGGAARSARLEGKREVQEGGAEVPEGLPLAVVPQRPNRLFRRLRRLSLPRRSRGETGAEIPEGCATPGVPQRRLAPHRRSSLGQS